MTLIGNDQSARPVVAVLSLGGTIAMSHGAAGAVPALTGDDLLAAVPSVQRIARVQARNLRGIPGASLRFPDLDELARAVEAAFDSGASGVVVTQGTDTIEETSFALDLLLQRKEPIVFTGAMRNPSLPGADGPANLHAAVLVAASAMDFGGVVVVISDEIHAARTVSKTHSTSPGAFVSPGSGPLGIVAEDRIIAFGQPARQFPQLPRRGVQIEVSVPIVTIGFDDDGHTLAAARGAQGVVLEALGGGHLPEWLVPEAESLAREMPVLLCSRTRSGAVLRHTYGFPGSETDLLARGLLTAEPLPSLKARILLMTLLRHGASHAEVAAYLHRLGQHATR